MTEEKPSLRQRLRHSLRPLLSTPLHPQWLVARQNRGRTAWIAQRATGDALDIGCANREIKPALSGCSSYLGLDYPATATGMYKSRPDVFGDARCLPFADASFDTILLLDVLEHVAYPESVLAEAARVMRRGGRLLLTIPFAYPMHDVPHDFQRFTEHGLAHRIRECGLHATVIHEVGNASEAASANLAMALAQGLIDAMSGRTWRSMWLPLVPPLVAAINMFGWLSGHLLPARGFMPAAYYVEARRN